MIKGSIEDRMEYEDYIRSLKDTVRYPFHKIYRKSEIIERYYLIKIAKEKRGFDLKEKRILNLMTLMDYVVRVGGIVYAWWWEEFLPKIISQMSNSKAEWVVSMDDIAKTFNCVPTKTVEAALLKTTALPDVVLNCLNAQRAGDLSVLAEQLCHISPDEIFESFKVIDAYKKICDLISEVDLADDKADRKAMYLVKDTLDVISPNETFDPVIAGNKLLNAASSFEIDENDVLSHPEKYLRAICLGLSLVRDCLNEELGESDPVAQTIREILDEEHFQRISNFYIQFPRDEEWCQTMCKKIMQWEKEYLGFYFSMNELGLEGKSIEATELQVDTHFLWRDRFEHFVDDCLKLERGVETEFAYRYRMNLIELIRETQTGTGLYAIAMLLFPVKPKPGRKGTSANLVYQPKLNNIIEWKANFPAPQNHQEVVAVLIQHFPHLKGYDSIDTKSVQPARLIEQLVKEVNRGRNWIKDFIGDYWSPDMAHEFEKKVKPR